MKRKFFFTGIIILLVCIMAVCVSAATYGDLTYTVSGGKVTITDCNTSVTSVTIPSKINGYPVTSIGDYAFYSCNSLTSIEIPDSVTIISDYAFYSCDSLATISIGNSVTIIGDYAFYSCDSLTSIEIPDSVTIISDYAFYSCDSLTSIEIPDSVTIIRDYAFCSCDSLATISIGNSVTIIGYYAFCCCDSLTSITVDSRNPKYSSDKRGALFNKDKTTLICYPLGNSATTYEIPDSVTRIGNAAFDSCDSLTNIEIPDSVTIIGAYAFCYCDNLTSIEIPDSVKSIGEQAFRECRSLTSIEIPDSVTIIGDYAFCDCDSLTSIEIPDSVKSIGDVAFCDCESLTSISIGNGVTSIGDSAFSSCHSLASISIGNGVTSIGDDAFSYCVRLTDVYYAGTEQDWEKISVDSGNNYLLNAKIHFKSNNNCGNNLTWTLDSEGTLTIKGMGKMTDWSNISDTPWYSNLNLIKKVVIKDGVTSIGNFAFYYCTGLTSVTIPNSVTSIGRSAFYGCERLTSVTFPDSLTTIDHEAFRSCKSLEKVTIGQNVENIGGNVFQNCTSLTSITVHPGNKNYSSEDGVLFDKDKTNIKCCPAGKQQEVYTIPNSVTSFSDGAFAYCSGVNSVIIPNSVTSIGGWAFAYIDTGFTSVYIPKSVTSIKKCAFDGCKSLTDVYYAGTEQDWKKISIGESNSYLLNATIHYNSKTESVVKDKVAVASGKYCFYVTDKSGKPIKDATVLWTDNIDTYVEFTNADGYAYLPAFTIDNPIVEISHSGYITWTNANSNWTKSSNRYEKIVLFSKENSNLCLQSAYYSNSSSMKSAVNVLSGTKIISYGEKGDLVGDLDFGYFYLECEAKESSVVSKYEMWQNKKKIAESTDGFFELLADNFDEGSGCFVRTISNNGTGYVDTHINLTFEKAKVVEHTSLSFTGGKGINISVGEDVPFVGGSNVSFECPINIPLTFKIETYKYQIGFNCDLTKDPNTFEKLKKKCDAAKSYATMPLDNNTKKELESLMIAKNKAKFFKDVDVSVIGYAEADIGGTTASGKLYILVSTSLFEAQYNTVVYVVPVTVQVKIEFDLEAGFQISYNWGSNTLNGSIMLNPALDLEAFGGAGISTFVGVGAYGSAILSAKINIVGTPSGVRNVDLTGELGLKAYLGFKEYKKAFAYNTWHLYTANSTASLSSEQILEENGFESGLYDASSYTLADLSYMESESEWLGSGGASLMAAEAQTAFKSLLVGTYRNARPVMVSDGKKLYAAFLRADENSRIYTALTSFDGESWCQPVRVNDDAVLEGVPELLVSENGDLWLAYSRTNGDIDPTSLMEFAEAQEIVVGTVDKETLVFTEKTVFSPGESTHNYIHSHTLTNVAGKDLLVYAASDVADESSVLLPDNHRYFATDLSDEQYASFEIGSIDMPVSQYVVGKKDEKLIIACVTETESGKDGYFVTDSGTELFAEDITGKLTYAVLPGTENADFVYNVENGLVSVGEESVYALGITNEYFISDNSIFYSMTTGGSANLAVVKYNDGTFTEPIQLTDENRYFENISVGVLNGNEYIMGMHTLPTISEEDVIDEKNLVWTRVTPVSDVRIDNVSYDADTLVPGEDTVVTLSVFNAGDHEITSLDIFVNGAEYSVEECSILPGASADFELTVECPDTLTEYTVSVSETDNDDYTPDNNEYALKLGYADLSVTAEEMTYNGSKQLVVYISNKGIAPASGTLELKGSDGTLIESTEFESIESLASYVVVAEFDEEDFFENGFDITATVVSDTEEFYTYNNTDSIHMTQFDRMSSITRFEYSDGVLYTDIRLSEDESADAYIAEYDIDGRFLCVHKNKLSLGTNEIKTDTFDEDCVYVELIVLSNDLSPLFESIGVNI